MLSSTRPMGLFAALFAALLLQVFFGLAHAGPIRRDTGAPQIPKDGLLGQDVDFWLNDVVDMFADKGVILDLDQLKGEDGYTKMMNDPAAKDITTDTVLDLLKQPEDPTEMPKLFDSMRTDPALDGVDPKATVVLDLADPVGRSDDDAAIMQEVPGSVDARDVYKSSGRSTLARILKTVAALQQIAPSPADFVAATATTARELGNMAGGQEKLAIASKTGNAVIVGAETDQGKKSPILDRIIAYFKSPGKPGKANPGEAFKNDPLVRLVVKGAKSLAAALKFQSDGTVVAPDGTVSDPKNQKPATTTTPPPSTDPNAPDVPTDPNAPTPPESQEPTNPGDQTPDDPNNPKNKPKPGKPGPAKPPRRL